MKNSFFINSTELKLKIGGFWGTDYFEIDASLLRWFLLSKKKTNKLAENLT